MKIRIEVDSALTEDELVIRCARVNDDIRRIQQFVQQQGAAAHRVVFYLDGQEYFFPVEDILFFETEGEHVFAHTEKEAFLTRLRLYELEEMLPRSFIRISKSTIVNTLKIYTIKRDITASSLVHFSGTHKQVYVSRRYYGGLRQRMQERST